MYSEHAVKHQSGQDKNLLLLMPLGLLCFSSSVSTHLILVLLCNKCCVFTIFSAAILRQYSATASTTHPTDCDMPSDYVRKECQQFLFLFHTTSDYSVVDIFYFLVVSCLFVIVLLLCCYVLLLFCFVLVIRLILQGLKANIKQNEYQNQFCFIHFCSSRICSS